jgi:hypothetical protein
MPKPLPPEMPIDGHTELRVATPVEDQVYTLRPSLNDVLRTGVPQRVTTSS